MKWRFFDQKIPPYEGGFLRWPEWLADDLMNIETMYQRILELK